MTREEAIEEVRYAIAYAEEEGLTYVESITTEALKTVLDALRDGERIEYFPNGTLFITIDHPIDAGRILLSQKGTQNGTLFYADEVRTEMSSADLISRQAAGGQT